MYEGSERRRTAHERDRAIIEEQRLTIGLLEARVGMRDREIDEVIDERDRTVATLEATLQTANRRIAALESELVEMALMGVER